MKDNFDHLSEAELERIIAEEEQGKEIPRDFSGILGVGTRGAAKGLGSIADLVALPANAALMWGDKEPLPSISEHIGKSIDYLTDNEFQPRNFKERALDTATEFIGGGKFLSKTADFTKSKLAEWLLKQKGFKGNIASPGLAGVGFETANEINPDSTRGKIVGTLAGGYSPSALENIFKNGGSLLKHTPKQHALGQYAGIDMNGATANKEAASKLGFHLTPAEASGNPFLAAKQGAQGYTPEGAKQLFDFQQGRGKKLENVERNFLNDVATGSSIKISPDEDLRTVAKSIINKKEKALQAEAKPFYDKAIPRKISMSRLKSLVNNDQTIFNSIKSVLKDPKYSVELKGFAPNSTKTLDLAKKNIDAQIEQFKNFGDKDAVRVLTASKHRLTNALDQLNPDYKRARSIYEEGSPAIEALNNGTIGKIANRKDLTIKNIGADIFDRTQTNPKIFKQVQKEIYKEDPNAWKNIVRQEMERKLGTSESGATNFFKKILKDNNTYRQFHEALSYNKNAQKNLALMRQSFPNLINSVSVKTAAAQAKSSLNVPRSTAQWILNKADKVLGTKYDKAAIDLITDPKWDERLKPIRKMDKPVNRVKALNILINEAAQENDKGIDMQSFDHISDEELQKIITEEEQGNVQ